MNSLFITRNHYDFIFFFANLLWIHFLFHEFIMKSLYCSRNYYAKLLFTFKFAKALWLNLIFDDFTMNSLSFSRIYYEFIFLFLKSLFFHFLFGYESLVFLLSYNSFAFCFGIHYEFPILLWIHLIFSDFTINSLSLSQMYYKFTI